MGAARVAVVVVAAASLLGCGASSRAVRGPDGEPGWFAINCRRNQANCYEEAGAVCPAGYSIADSQGRMVYASGASVNRYGGNAWAASGYQGELLVKCK